MDTDGPLRKFVDFLIETEGLDINVISTTPLSSYTFKNERYFRSFISEKLGFSFSILLFILKNIAIF